jgi:hypothetical protein
LSVHDGAVEGRVTYDSADRKGIVNPRHSRKLGNLIDVNEMSRPCHPEGHDRNETLTPSEDATVLGAKLGKHGGGFRDRSRNVTSERRGLHL